jgi:hypothetical protein
MYLAWVEVVVEVVAEDLADGATSSASAVGAAITAPSKDVGANSAGDPQHSRHHSLVEMKFSALRDARDWASRQLCERTDTTGHAAIFQTSGPFIRLAWEALG